MPSRPMLDATHCAAVHNLCALAVFVCSPTSPTWQGRNW